MPISIGKSLVIIAAVALFTFITRVFPFILFPKGKRIPDIVEYLGRMLTPAVVGMLVVYCLKATDFLKTPNGLPEVIAVGVTALLHAWKKNNLLSIGVGTVLYMFLVQYIFK